MADTSYPEGYIWVNTTIDTAYIFSSGNWIVRSPDYIKDVNAENPIYVIGETYLGENVPGIPVVGPQGLIGPQGLQGLPGTDATVTGTLPISVVTGVVSIRSATNTQSGAVTANQIQVLESVATASHSNSLDHTAGSDNQDLSGLVEKVTGSSLVADTEIVKIHVSGSDNQDLSGKADKVVTYLFKNLGGAVSIGEFDTVIVVDSASTQTLTLPVFVTADIGKRIGFLKLGIGRLTVTAYTGVCIQDSGAGDTIYCADAGVARLYLEVISTTQMNITGGLGNWWTTD